MTVFIRRYPTKLEEPLGYNTLNVSGGLCPPSPFMLNQATHAIERQTIESTKGEIEF